VNPDNPYGPKVFLPPPPHPLHPLSASPNRPPLRQNAGADVQIFAFSSRGRLSGKGDGWGGCGRGGKELLGPYMVLPAPPALHFAFKRERRFAREIKKCRAVRYSGGGQERGRIISAAWHSFVTQGVLLFLGALLFLASPSFAQTQPAPPTSRGAAPEITQDDLPDSVLHGDIYAVVSLDLAKGDKTAWNNAAAVIMGGQPSTRPLTASDPLPMGLNQSLGPIFATGADRLVLGVLWTNNNNASMCLRLPPGASDAAARKWLHSATGGGETIQQQGQWLIVQPAIARRAPLTPRAEEFRQDLECWGDDVPFRIVYIPTQPMKAAAANPGQMPHPVFEMFNVFLSAKYLYIGGLLGADPQLEIRWAAQDENSADAVIKQFEQSRDEVKRNGASSGLPAFFPVLLQNLDPRRDGNVARVSLSRQQMATIFTQVLIASAVNRNQPGGQQAVSQSPVAADWVPTDAATDAAAAQMRLILQAIRAYDREHQSLPNSLDDLVNAKLLPGPEILHDPRTGQDNGFLLLKPSAAQPFADNAATKIALLVETKNAQPDFTGLVGYADGHVQMAK
jgi:hypothetical protein